MQYVASYVASLPRDFKTSPSYRHTGLFQLVNHVVELFAKSDGITL